MFMRPLKKATYLRQEFLNKAIRRTVVGADGAVYADYWVEYSFSLPKTIHYKVQGEEKVEFSFHRTVESEPD